MLVDCGAEGWGVERGVPRSPLAGGLVFEGRLSVTPQATVFALTSLSLVHVDVCDVLEKTLEGFLVSSIKTCEEISLAEVEAELKLVEFFLVEV